MKNHPLSIVLLSLAIVWGLTLPPVAAEPTVTINQLVANHVKSIGTPEALAAAKARQIDGTSHFSIVVGGHGELDGKAALVCDDQKMKMGVLFNNPSYDGEAFTSDGKNVFVKSASGGVRSLLGGFVYTHSQLMSEGLMGGALSSSWAMLHLKERHANISLDGLKNVDGAALYEVSYRPKKNSNDLEIKLYFDQNFRHVLSKYSVTIGPQLGRYLVEEAFSDFGQFNNVTLPQTYKLRITYEQEGVLALKGNGSRVWMYDVKFQHFVNAPVPEKVFAIR